MERIYRDNVKHDSNMVAHGVNSLSSAQVKKMTTREITENW